MKRVQELFGATPGLGNRQETVDQLRQKHLPSTEAEQFKLARDHAQSLSLFRTVLGAQQAFANFGMKVRPAEGGKRNRAWKQWWRQVRGPLTEFVRSAWWEWLAMDAVIAFWWDEALAQAMRRPDLPVYCLKPERCTYRDAMGVVSLEVEHGLTPDQVRRLPPKWRDRYRSGRVQLDPAWGEMYRVCKRAAVGDGLGKPALYSAFQLAGQCDSMEASDYLIAYASRTLVRQHKIGHEIKQGPNAGRPTHFYKEARGAAVRKFFEGRVGFTEVTGNFDHSIEHVAVDPKLFDDSKWEGVQRRIAWWGGPVAAMLFARQEMPYLLPILKATIAEDREKLGLFLEGVIQEVFTPPGDAGVELVWSNRCFADPRTAAELLKFGVTQGATSLETYNEQSGNDHSEERDRKQTERREEDIWRPTYDAAHGESTAATGEDGRAVEARRQARGAEDSGGRPEGT